MSVQRCAAQRPLPIGWRTHWVCVPALNVGHTGAEGGGGTSKNPTKINPRPAITKKTRQACRNSRCGG